MFMIAFVGRLGFTPAVDPYCVFHPHKCWPAHFDQTVKWCLTTHKHLNLSPVLFLGTKMSPQRPCHLKRPLMSLSLPWNAPRERRAVRHFTSSLWLTSYISLSLYLSGFILHSTIYFSRVFVVCKGGMNNRGSSSRMVSSFSFLICQ